MIASSIAELITNLYNDHDYRARFTSNPQAVLAELSLTAEERRAAMQLHERMVAGGTASTTAYRWP